MTPAPRPNPLGADAEDVARLRQRLSEAEDALRAIRSGEVDALVVQGAHGPRVFTQRSADRAYRVLIEQMYEGAATLGASGDLLYANRRMAELLGRPIQEVIGRPLLSFFSGPARTDVQALLAAAAAEAGHAGGEAESIAGVPLLLAVSQLPEGPDGASGQFAVVASDLSLRRAAEAAESKRQRLEELVQARTADLQVALEAAQAASRAKATFLANMSHEIRTPLNAVLGMAYLMRQEPLTPKQKARLDVVDEAGRHLLALIVDVLDLSKIEAGALRLERGPVAPADVVREVQALLIPQAEQKGLRLLVDIGPDVPDALLGDETRLRQALLNLASNAVKFTDQGQVRLRLHVLEVGPRVATLCFEVHDTGRGVEPGVASRLFKPFEQGDASMSRHYGGSGLGLAITRELANLMGGLAGQRPAPGGGSVFWFTARLALPTARLALRVPPTPDTPQAAIAAAHAGARVLVVDDDPVGLELTCAMVHLAGLQADGASSGPEALARVASGVAYALVLMDMQMPSMDGMACTRALRLLPGGNRIPIIACTANAYADHRLACTAAGMDDFLTKPLDPAALYEAMLRWLPGRGPGAPA